MVFHFIPIIAAGYLVRRYRKRHPAVTKDTYQPSPPPPPPPPTYYLQAPPYSHNSNQSTSNNQETKPDPSTRHHEEEIAHLKEKARLKEIADLKEKAHLEDIAKLKEKAHLEDIANLRELLQNQNGLNTGSGNPVRDRVNQRAQNLANANRSRWEVREGGGRSMPVPPPRGPPIQRRNPYDTPTTPSLPTGPPPEYSRNS